MNASIKGKNIILIGGSGNIGKCLLNRLLEEGCRVGVTYNNTYIDNSHTFYKEYHDNLFVEKVDTSCFTSIKNGLSKLIKKLELVDALVYNSGICQDSLLGTMRIDDWKKVMAVNMDGAFLSARLISNHMIKNKISGKILFISSTKGTTGSYGQSNYAASKAALIGFSKSIAKELGKFGIAVNVICPGFIPTNLNRDAPYKKQLAIEQSVLKKTSNEIEIVNFTIYLLSDLVSTASGQTFHLDSRM